MCNKWYRLLCKSSELQLKGTLDGGQSFRWQHNPDTDEWTGVFSQKLWVIKQQDDHLQYKVFESDEKSESESNKNEEEYNSLLSSYFRLDLNLREYYEKWSLKDRYFKEAATQFYGVRILNQDVVENIFSFICSSNNHIKRISSMVNKLGQFYGKKIHEIDGNEFYTFPDVEKLAQKGVEEKLKANGFGYRAKYIHKSAQTIVENGGNEWLEKLKTMPYFEAKQQLMTLHGIGAKVADCVCLMSLGHLNAIPVDVHMYQIASRLYLPQLKKQKTLNERIYNQIGDHFRELYGPLAGWAHTVLFCADLKKFQQAAKPLPTKKHPEQQ